MDDKAMDKIKREIDIKLATEISKATVHEMAKLKETKTNKLFHITAMMLMAIITIICIIFTSIIGIKLIGFLNSFEVSVEEDTKQVNMDASSNSGNANNFYKSSNNNVGVK